MKNVYIFLMIILSVDGYAKRLAPKVVSPIVYNGIIYQTVPWRIDNGTSQNGGFITAVNVTTGKVIWLKQVYKTNYNPRREKDVQDVFIKSLELNKNKTHLIIKNGDNQVFNLDLNGRLLQ